MAVVRMKAPLLSFKSLLKTALLVALVVFVLVKLFGDSAVGQTEISLLRSHLDEKVQTFTKKESAKIKQTDVTDVHVDVDVSRMVQHKPNNRSQISVLTSKLHAMWNWTDSLLTPTDAVYVLIPFAKAKVNEHLQTKFRTCVTSMSEMSSASIVLFIAGDKESRGIATDIVGDLRKKNVKLHHLDVDVLGEGMKDTIDILQQHFGDTRGSYYSHTLFFLSAAIHHLAPPSLPRLIMLDSDLKFQDDIKRLNDLFQQFLPSNVMGIAHENQPVYRHMLATYRQSHPDTRAGEPGPDGLPGFNSGVVLLDLDRMRRSECYNRMLDTDILKTLAEKYSYKGHLGDQDFYSLVSLEHEDLFFVLPCGWNRQLCQWWRDNGYKDVFDQYFVCNGKISIYHGNCNTPFPNQ